MNTCTLLVRKTKTHSPSNSQTRFSLHNKWKTSGHLCRYVVVFSSPSVVRRIRQQRLTEICRGPLVGKHRHAKSRVGQMNRQSNKDPFIPESERLSTHFPPAQPSLQVRTNSSVGQMICICLPYQLASLVFPAKVMVASCSIKALSSSSFCRVFVCFCRG